MGISRYRLPGDPSFRCQEARDFKMIGDMILEIEALNRRPAWSRSCKAAKMKRIHNQTFCSFLGRLGL